MSATALPAHSAAAVGAALRAEGETHAAPALADLDDDGRTDLLVGTGSGALRAYRNVGTEESPQYVRWEDQPLQDFSPTTPEEAALGPLLDPLRALRARHDARRRARSTRRRRRRWRRRPRRVCALRRLRRQQPPSSTCATPASRGQADARRRADTRSWRRRASRASRTTRTHRSRLEWSTRTGARTLSSPASRTLPAAPCADFVNGRGRRWPWRRRRRRRRQPPPPRRPRETPSGGRRRVRASAAPHDSVREDPLVGAAAAASAVQAPSSSSIWTATAHATRCWGPAARCGSRVAGAGAHGGNGALQVWAASSAPVLVVRRRRSRDDIPVPPRCRRRRRRRPVLRTGWRRGGHGRRPGGSARPRSTPSRRAARLRWRVPRRAHVRGQQWTGDGGSTSTRCRGGRSARTRAQPRRRRTLIQVAGGRLADRHRQPAEVDRGVRRLRHRRRRSAVALGADGPRCVGGRRRSVARGAVAAALLAAHDADADGSFPTKSTKPRALGIAAVGPPAPSCAFGGAATAGLAGWRPDGEAVTGARWRDGSRAWRRWRRRRRPTSRCLVRV